MSGEIINSRFPKMKNVPHCPLRKYPGRGPSCFLPGTAHRNCHKPPHLRRPVVFPPGVRICGGLRFFAGCLHLRRPAFFRRVSVHAEACVFSPGVCTCGGLCFSVGCLYMRRPVFFRRVSAFAEACVFRRVSAGISRADRKEGQNSEGSGSALYSLFFIE